MQFGDDLPTIFANTQVRQAPDARITTIELRSALIAFASERGVAPDTIGNGAIRRVADLLQTNFGATRRKTNGRPFYEGVSLVPHDEPEASGSHDVDLDEL